MIKRVARTLWPFLNDKGELWEQGSIEEHEEALEAAEAVLKAIATPTPAMILAAFEAPKNPSLMITLKLAYEAMIKEAFNP